MMFIELQNDKTYDGTCSLVNKLRPSMKVNDCELNYSKVKTYENESLLLDENLKQITEKIEEEFNEYSSETSFFKKEFHSIIPFLVLKNQMIHRLTLSDYDIKKEKKEFKTKLKMRRLTPMDYYKKGLLHFYLGNYQKAFQNFKMSSLLRKDNANIIKWLVFSAVKILFSTEKEKEHFESYDSNNESLYILKNDSHKEKEGLINRINNIFDCCISRKKDKESTKNNKYISSIFKDNSKNIYNNKISLSLLIEEIEDGVHFIISDSEREDKENVISIWWIILIVSSYCKLYPSIKGNFHLNVFSLEPKVIIKKAKEIDEYLAYIMYIQWKYLTEGNFYLTEMKNVLDDLFRKYPHRIEGYLFYWEFLTKSSLKEYYKALQISQTVYSQLNVLDDNELYFYYVVITYSKSLMYNGKYSQIMRLLKQEFYHNLSYTSLYLYLGIILAKSKAKTLLSESVSILTNTSSLVYTDLKFLSYYWIGYVYYSLVDYINCYKYWKKCHASNYKYSNKKTVYIEKFISKYKNVFNNLNDIKQSQFIESATKIKSMIRRNQSLYAFCDYVILKYRLLQSMKIEDFEREYISLLVHYPNIEKFYYAFWKELKKRNKISLLITFSFYMLLSFQHQHKNIKDIIKSYVYFSKCLSLIHKYDESISLLLQLLQYQPYYNIMGLFCLNQVYELNNLNKVNSLQPKQNYLSLVNLNRSTILDIYHQYGKNSDANNVHTILRNSIENLLKNEIKNIQRNDILFTSYSEILYQIGKVALVSRSNISLGIICLKDYCKIIKFHHNYSSSLNNKKKYRMRYKAKFIMGQLYSISNNYSKTYEIFSKINQTYLKHTKSTLIKEFMNKYNNKQFNLLLHLFN